MVTRRLRLVVALAPKSNAMSGGFFCQHAFDDAVGDIQQVRRTTQGGDLGKGRVLMQQLREAIPERWGCVTPWSRREKHVRWFLNHYLSGSAPVTLYYFELTARLIPHAKSKYESDA